MALLLILAVTAFASALPPRIRSNNYITGYEDLQERQEPWISVRVEGSASEEGQGRLAVYPGSVVHLECVYPRKMGNPEWTWTSPLTTYLTGWSVSPEERGWKYKLSIYYAKEEDSGIFTCSTPKGKSSSITLDVQEVHCDSSSAMPPPPVQARVEGTRLGQAVFYSCPTGYSLSGKAKSICRSNGQWSDDIPSCREVICPSLNPADSRLVVSGHNTSFGARISLSCPWGYRITGPSEIECLVTSRWSHQLPTCEVVRCSGPSTPRGGRIVDEEGQEKREYRVGDVVKFSCDSNHNLQGHQTIVCTDTGLWSQPPPNCSPFCDYPGEPSNGRLMPLKFTYEPGDRLKVTCRPGFVSRVDASSVCLSTGNWSQPLPQCTNYTDV